MDSFQRMVWQIAQQMKQNTHQSAWLSLNLLTLCFELIWDAKNWYFSEISLHHKLWMARSEIVDSANQVIVNLARFFNFISFTIRWTAAAAATARSVTIFRSKEWRFNVRLFPIFRISGKFNSKSFVRQSHFSFSIYFHRVAHLHSQKVSPHWTSICIIECQKNLPIFWFQFAHRWLKKIQPIVPWILLNYPNLSVSKSMLFISHTIGKCDCCKTNWSSSS